VGQAFESLPGVEHGVVSQFRSDDDSRHWDARRCERSLRVGARAVSAPLTDSVIDFVVPRASLCLRECSNGLIKSKQGAESSPCPVIDHGNREPSIQAPVYTLRGRRIAAISGARRAATRHAEFDRLSSGELRSYIA
jgi:hypothetical protein